MTKQQDTQRKIKRGRLPIVKNEDVEYSAELADADDVEAVERSEQADNRQEHF